MPGRELCLLSLDGGGVRGLSSLAILKRLMENINLDAPPKPCEYFDMIGGTSTGGLMAIMLGRLEMDIDQCIEAYIALSDRVFRKKQHRIKVNGQVQGRFDTAELEQSIRDIVKQMTSTGENTLLKGPKGQMCKVFVCATSKENADTVHFTSYPSSRWPSDLYNTTRIWEAARATSAASSFFDPIKIGKFKEEFVDGAVGANNPAAQLWNEATDTWRDEKLEHNVKCFVSIGTGVPSLAPYGSNLLEIAQTLKNIATETEKTAETFHRAHSDLDHDNRYFRFNVTHGLENVVLEDATQKNVIMAATRRYVATESVVKQMRLFGTSLSMKEPSYALSEEDKRCLQTLYCGSDYEAHKMRNPEPVPGTCGWILKHDNFSKWQEQNSSNLLWISADPGSGKSVLTRFLIDNLSGSNLRDKKNLCFFFFKDDSDEQNNAVLALRAILHQLFQIRPALLKYALPHFRNKEKSFVGEIYTLWNILINSTADEKAGETICVVDGLDECESSTQAKFVDMIAKFFNSAGNSSNQPQLKFLVTSRPYHTIERRIQYPLTIRLKVEDEGDLTSGDVKLVIEKRIQDFSCRTQISDDLKRILTDRILSMSDRTFLWTSLILDYLDKSLRTSDKSLLGLIERIPESLDEMYESILNKTGDRQATARILHIVVGAVRPLSLKEMNVALFIKSDDRELNDLNLEPVINLANAIRNLGGLFVKIVNSRIYLIHQTARAFLIKTDQHVSSESNLWRHSLSSIETERTLAEICVNYFMLKDFEDPSYCNQSQHISPGEEYYFLEYVTANWALHFQKVQSEAGDQLVKSVRSIYDAKSARFDIWLKKYPFPRFLKSLPFTKLIAASFFGHELIIPLLLESGADTEAKGGDGTTALYQAAWNGHEAIVKLLLDRGANAQAKDNNGRTALYRAARNGHEAIVKLLLDREANAQVKDNNGTTVLYRAVWNGYEAVTKLLLDRGANGQAKNTNGNTILHGAAWNGHEAIVKLLLDRGANAQAEDDDGTTALHWAASSGHEAIVKLLKPFLPS
ncbi:MAG: hypothetical protein M1814_006883 [Vezdaea aestivalis]|nr:MAG: hypothetical protein M1814_006883 [Vezdaea aestivalis]